MEYCASYHNIIYPDNAKDPQLNHSKISPNLTSKGVVDHITTTIFPSTAMLQNNHNTDGYNHAAMDIQGNGLDLISNWKAESNEEENGMAISVYVGIHVVIGLIGVVFNGL